MELLENLLHLRFCFLVHFRAFLKYLLDLIADFYELTFTLLGAPSLNKVVRSSWQEQVDIQLACEVHWWNQLIYNQIVTGLIFLGRWKLILESQVCLREEKVCWCKRLVNLEVQFLIDLNSRLKSFERLRVHLVLLICDRKLVPGEDVLCAQLFLQDTVRAAILV